MDDLLKRHAKEATTLESSLKMLAPKPRFGKQPTPDALAAADALAATKRAELAARHAAEIAHFDAAPAAECAPPPAPAGAPAAEGAAAGASESDSDADDAGAGAGAGDGASKRGKAARRRERKEARAAAERAAIAAADAAAPPRESARDAELRALHEQLRPLALGIAHVPGDGHCLFRALAHQLVVAAGDRGAGVGAAATADAVARLRGRAADFIATFWEEFAPFLPYEAADAFPGGEGAEAGPAARAAVGRYCARLAASSCWGGHPEIRALSNVLGCPIVVFRAGAKPLQFSPRGGEGEAHAARNVLRLSFHGHYYASEHYNSVV